MEYVQLKRPVGKNEKLESFRLESLKLESFGLSWIERNVGYTIDLCLKYFSHLIYYTESVKPYPYLDRPDQFNFPIFMYFSNQQQLSNLFDSFQVQSKFSNIFNHVPTSAQIFQLRLELSNFIFPILIRTFQLKSFQYLVLKNTLISYC